MAKLNEGQKFDDHLFVALSIIIGFAITEALESWTQIIKNLEYIQISYLHLFWSLVAFYLAIQYWWGLWKYQDIQWGFSNFLLFLCMAISIFMLNDLIYPDILKGEALSLTDYFIDIHSWYFSAMSVLLLLMIIRSFRIVKRSAKDRVNITYYFAFILSIVGIFSYSSVLYHFGLVSAAIILIVLASNALKLIIADKK